jgi:hypothetical protein
VNQTKESSKGQPPVKGRRKILRWVLLAGAAAIVLVVLLVPLFVSSEAGSKFILAKINNYLPGETNFGSLSMGWLKGIRVTDVRFKDSAGRTLVSARRVATRPNYSSIVLGTPSFGRTVIDKLVVEVKSPKESKVWTCETIELSAINAKVNIASDTAAKTIAVGGLRLKSPQINIDEGGFSLVSKSGRTNLRGQLNYVYDWAMAGELVREFLPKGLSLKGKREGTISFTSEYPDGETDKLWANLSTGVKLGFEEADYMGLIFGPTEVDIKVEKGLLTIAPFSSIVNNGRFNFAGQADFRDEPAMFKAAAPMQLAEDVRITNEMTARLLMYLNPVFAGAVNVSGVVSLSCEKLAIPLAGGSKNDIELVGTISVENLRLEAAELLGQILAVANIARAQDITIRPTRFALQNGLLRYDDMQMYVGDNPVNFKGVIGLDKSLDMTVTLPYTTKGETARIGKETRGRRIILVLRGTLDKPEIDLGRVLEEQLRQELEEKLLEGLDKLLKQSKERR